MATLFEQNEIETGKHLTGEGKSRYYLSNNLIFYKHLLQCRSCSWNISYSEYSGALDISDESVLCPVCKEGKIGYSKFIQNR
jgi:hypothetical protein